MKKERKLPMWTNVDPDLIEELDKICRVKYLTRAQCLREAILFYIKDYNGPKKAEHIHMETTGEKE